MARFQIDHSVSNPVSPSDGNSADEPQVLEKDHGGLHSVGEVRRLVLDDDQAVCRVIQSALAQTDFVLDAVFDPAHVKAQLQAKPYHVIILDYVIPGLEPEQVLGWVHQYQPQASIVVVTA